MPANTQPYNPLDGERPELSFNLQDGTDERISIIIVHRDRPEYLNICLQSIVLNSVDNNYQLIVVDNASGQDSQDYLDEIEGDVQVVRLPTNMYWSEAANKGVAASDRTSKYLIFLHCDVVILNPAWLDILIMGAESHKAGMVGTEMQSYFVANTKMDFIQEWCVLMTRECFDDVGPWETDLQMVGGAFIMSLKAQHKGHRPQVIKTLLAHHYRIFSLDINEYEKQIESASSRLPRLMQQIQSI